MFRFKCRTCDEWHEGMPAFGLAAPALYETIPETEREARAVLGTDQCIIDETHFFVLGRLEIPIDGLSEPFAWLVWLSISERDYEEYERYYDAAKRSQLKPYDSRLSVSLPLYPDTLGLEAKLRQRDGGLRPSVLLNSSDHLLAKEQCHGITEERVAEIFAHCMHGAG